MLRDARVANLPSIRLQVRQPGSARELTFPSQKEFLELWNRGVIEAGDLGLRGERWVRAGDLPWIREMTVQNRHDSRRLLWITLAMMLLGLLGVLYIQSHAPAIARRTGALPPGSVRAVPAR